MTLTLIPLARQKIKLFKRFEKGDTTFQTVGRFVAESTSNYVIGKQFIVVSPATNGVEGIFIDVTSEPVAVPGQDNIYQYNANIRGLQSDNKSIPPDKFSADNKRDHEAGAIVAISTDPSIFAEFVIQAEAAISSSEKKRRSQDAADARKRRGIKNLISKDVKKENTNIIAQVWGWMRSMIARQDRFEKSLIAQQLTFNDSTFEVYGDIDSTKRVKISTLLISAGETRIVTIPNEDGRILTLTEILAIFGGNNLTGHYHSTDRARGNHTGTQTASTISNFASAVAANPAVTLNSAKSTNANHSGDMSGSGQLTAQRTIITGKTLKSTLTGTEQLLADDGSLKRINVNSIAELASGTKVIWRQSNISMANNTQYTYYPNKNITQADFSDGRYVFFISRGSGTTIESSLCISPVTNYYQDWRFTSPSWTTGAPAQGAPSIQANTIKVKQSQGYTMTDVTIGIMQLW